MPLNRFKDKRLKEIFEYISEINREAYKDVYLLSNQVLSKNLNIDGFFDNYLDKKGIETISHSKVFSNIILYYRNSFFRFSQHLIQKFVFYLSSQKCDLKAIKDELVLIDTFFLVKNILQEGSFEDPFFVGLDKLLESRGKTYAYLPVFHSNDSFKVFSRILKTLKKDKVPILTEHQLLSLEDVAHLFLFILIYPFRVLKLAFELNSDTYIARFLKYYLIASLRYSTLHSFSRYLLGRKLSAFPCNIKIISWFENQVIHKNLYRGIRETKSKYWKKVYGCQLFIYPFSLLNINADPNEIENNTVPDKVLVNGSYYLYENNGIHSTVGPSFRYRKLFETNIDFNKRSNLLIVLPYFVEEINYILRIIRGINYKNGGVIVRFHPTTNTCNYKKLIPTFARISNEDLYDLFLKTKIVIGAASGTLVESVSLAIPAIVLQSNEKFIHNYLPENGRGIVWDYAKSTNDVNQLLEQFQYKLDWEKETLLHYAKEYKKVLFSVPTEEKIVETLDL